MIYTDAKGNNYYIDRKDAQQTDIEQNRQRMNGYERAAFKELTVLLQVITRHTQQLRDYMRDVGTYNAMRCAIGNYRRAIHETTTHICIQQLCNIQHDCKDVNVTVSRSVTAGKTNIASSDLKDLVTVARGGLHDEHNQYANCRSCLYCMNRSQWQNCEFYRLLQRIDCQIDEQIHTDKSVCPYAMIGGQQNDD